MVWAKRDSRRFSHIRELEGHYAHLSVVMKRITKILETNDRRPVPWDPEAVAYFRQVLGKVRDGLEWFDEVLR